MKERTIFNHKILFCLFFIFDIKGRTETASRHRNDVASNSCPPTCDFVFYEGTKRCICSDSRLWFIAGRSATAGASYVLPDQPTMRLPTEATPRRLMKRDECALSCDLKAAKKTSLHCCYSHADCPPGCTLYRTFYDSFPVTYCLCNNQITTTTTPSTPSTEVDYRTGSASSSTAMIIGACVGSFSFVFLVMIIIATVCVCKRCGRREQRSRTSSRQTNVTAASHQQRLTTGPIVASAPLNDVNIQWSTPSSYSYPFQLAPPLYNNIVKYLDVEESVILPPPYSASSPEAATCPNVPPPAYDERDFGYYNLGSNM